MSDLTVLYERNAAFAGTFSEGHLPMKPNIGTIILTCVDARVDPAHFVKLGLGDALVLRTVGGRATDTAILEVAMLWQLMKLGADGADPTLGLAIIHHSDCGMAKFAVPQVADTIAEVFGTHDVIDTYAISDDRGSVVVDVDRVAQSLRTPVGLAVSGHLYDVKTGSLEEIVPVTIVG